jgi:quinoprotein dehydrogenase-associated probable ABC transporter substrate-binding protein
VRNTLSANRCDLIIGVAVGEELVQNTNPYYRTSYVLVYRSNDAAYHADLGQPGARTARIGVMAGSPPVDLLVRKGLLAAVRSYPPVVDTRIDQPARRMIEDLAAGDIDIALSWGPIAGYWASRQNVPLTLVPLATGTREGPKLDSRISMGIRQNEPDWKHQLNALIRELQPDIDQILKDYGVPLLDNQGRLIVVASPTRESAKPMSEPQDGAIR